MKDLQLNKEDTKSELQYGNIYIWTESLHQL